MDDGIAVAGESFQGFIVHAYPDLRRDRLYFLGRLADGRSFAAVEENWRPYIHVFESDRNRALSLLSVMRFEELETELESFTGAERLCCLSFPGYGDRARAAKLLEEALIHSPDATIKPADLFMMEKHIRGPALLRGHVQPGRRVDLVIRNPEFSAPEQGAFPAIPLRTASIDIETDTKSGLIRAVSIAWADGLIGEPVISGLVRVLSLGENADSGKAQQDRGGKSGADDNIFFHHDERSLLAAFVEDVRRIDPDVLTGWNFLDFDFPRLAERCGKLGNTGWWQRNGYGLRRRSAAAIVPGRQVLDALRITRAGTWGSVELPVRGGLRDSWGDEGASNFSLETVSRAVLGEGKIVHSSGEEKIVELDRLYAADPVRFGEYCLRDAELVLRILAKTGLFRLTLERASLTGVSLDKAWTSVVSFERIYGMELRRNGITPPSPDSEADVSGAAGGTVLDPLPGLFENVAVFDFRSLYPTIMRTFNIDPLAHARVEPEQQNSPLKTKNPSLIIAPNGATFSRKPGLLPALIAEYFAARRAALESGDSIAAQVYKILMNSFYGVLGTGACRYGRTELAGSITSFARKWLLFSRDWFTGQGFRVLYGDTDSLFVETGFGDSASLADFEERCGSLTKELNRLIAETVRAEYDLESFIELRFEKAYRRFLIPPLRNIHSSEGSVSGGESRGRAKGYGGYLIQRDENAGRAANGDDRGGLTMRVEVKGMEAVRSDSTPLARHLQMELLELVFSGGGEEVFREKVSKTLEEMRDGKLDGELIYRKRFSRYPETYTSSTPPQVKAARALGWKKRRGTVEFLWTVNGPEPVALPHGKPDYDHYAESQVFPVAHSIAAAAHWDADFFVPRKGRAAGGFTSGQMELDL
ncbi:DNA polymerase [Spirochaetia bacterium]|nr:DNA polymerase [Spirochaetia bacterium]